MIKIDTQSFQIRIKRSYFSLPDLEYGDVIPLAVRSAQPTVQPGVLFYTFVRCEMRADGVRSRRANDDRLIIVEMAFGRTLCPQSGLKLGQHFFVVGDE